MKYVAIKYTAHWRLNSKWQDIQTHRVVAIHQHFMRRNTLPLPSSLTSSDKSKQKIYFNDYRVAISSIIESIHMVRWTAAGRQNSQCIPHVVHGWEYCRWIFAWNIVRVHRGNHLRRKTSTQVAFDASFVRFHLLNENKINQDANKIRRYLMQTYKETDKNFLSTGHERSSGMRCWLIYSRLKTLTKTFRNFFSLFVLIHFWFVRP